MEYTAFFVIFVIVLFLGMVSGNTVSPTSSPVKNIEKFTAPGLTLTRPSEWFFKKRYNPSNWLTPYYPDQLSQPACLSYYRGNPEPLNYMSSAYRYWRF